MEGQEENIVKSVRNRTNALGLVAVASFFAVGAARGNTDTWGIPGNDGMWHLGAPADWYIGTPPAVTGEYSDGDAVIFDDTATSGFDITVANGGVSAASVTFNNSTNAYSFTGGPIGGSGTVTMNGSGMVTLRSVNSYTGGTVFNGGILNAAAGSLGTGLLSFNGGTLQFNGAFDPTTTTTGTNPVTLNGDGGTFDTNGQNISIAGAVVGAGGLTKVGSGSLTMTGSNTYTGATIINGGTLSGGDTIPTGGPVVVNGGTLDLVSVDGLEHAHETLSYGSLSGNSSSGLITDSGTTAGTDALTFNQTNDGTYAGSINDGPARSIALTKTGPNTLILSGSNNYSGGTTITGGLLEFSSASSLPSTATGSILITAPGALAATGAFTDVSSTIQAVDSASTGAVALVSSGSPINDTADFSTHDSLSLGAVGLVTYTGQIIPGSGGYMLGGGGGVLTLPAASGPYQLTGNNSLTVGNNGLPGAVALGAANNYTGGTTVAGGTLVVSAYGATGAGDVAVATLPGTSGTLAGTGTILGNVRLGAGGTISPDGGTLTIAQSLTLVANSTLSYNLTTNDLIQVNGNLSAPASGTVNVNINAISQYTNYPLINYTGPAPGAGTTWNLTFGGMASPPGVAAQVSTSTNGVVSLDFTSGPTAPTPPYMLPHGTYIPPSREPNLPPGSPVMTCYNEDIAQLVTGTTQYQLNLVLAGDVGPGGFSLTGYPTFGPAGDTGIAYHYNSVTNYTTISIYPTASSPFINGVPYGFDGHIGYCLPVGPGGGHEGQSPLVLAKYWGGCNGYLPVTPAPGNYLPVGRFTDSVTNIGVGQPFVFCILYSEVESNEGGNWSTASEWSELQVPIGQAFNVQLFDDAMNNAPDFVFDAKFMFSTTEIPLDDLGSTYENPDTSGLFQSLTIPSPQVLIPGLFDGEEIPAGSDGTAQLIYTMPEPATASAMAILAAGLFIRRQRSPKPAGYVRS
jgi:autotransporter-associated beta strand protein